MKKIIGAPVKLCSFEKESLLPLCQCMCLLEY